MYTLKLASPKFHSTKSVSNILPPINLSKNRLYLLEISTRNLSTQIDPKVNTIPLQRDSINFQPNFKEIEAKWSERWGKSSRLTANDIRNKHNALKNSHSLNEQNNDKHFYALSMFPYPSGNLHMGHVRVYTISDSISRYHHLTGKNVIHPMGWDAFGLPAENAAIDNNTKPSTWTHENIKTMKTQLKNIMIDIDWEKEFATCEPNFYKWTQYIFLQLYKRGLIYQKEAVVNWDPVDKTVLANEQVDKNGCSWRSGAVVEKKRLKQWFIKITAFSEELLNDLETLDKWPEHVKQMQRNWIGKSEGAEFDFYLNNPSNSENKLQKISVFTTRPDTIFGVSYIAISSEHPLVQQGSVKIPIYIADYVLADYGNGAVMGVPAHDQ
ncbi:hypothetical protein BB559_003649, partial [Furculomyces boomerangus]